MNPKHASLPALDLDILRADFALLQAQGVAYSFGAKPSFALLANPRAPLNKIRALDCSGFVRLALFRASRGALLWPDGSQQQLAFAGRMLRQVDYEDAGRWISPTRAFIAFIKPNTFGSGGTGHVWLLDGASGQAQTMESYSGVGVGARPWDEPVLAREVFGCFELPTMQRQAEFSGSAPDDWPAPVLRRMNSQPETNVNLR